MTDKEISALIETLKANNEELLKQVALLTEQVAYLTNKLYGKSSKRSLSTQDQLSLFEEDNASQETPLKMTRTCHRITETITYKRRKQVGKKQDILDSLPGEELHHRLDNLTCPDCQHELKEIGSFCARKKSCSTFQPKLRESITSSTLTSASTAVIKRQLTRLSKHLYLRLR